MDKFKWLDWANETRSLAIAGIYYGEDEYIIERYRRLLKISFEILEMYTDSTEGEIEEYFKDERGYQTPKIDGRAVIFKKDKILLLKIKDNYWTLPGGLVDEDLSLKEYISKYLKNNLKKDIEAIRLLSIKDSKIEDNPNYLFNSFKFFVLCEELNRENNDKNNIFEYFTLEEIEKLKLGEIDESQIKSCFFKYFSDDENIEFD